MAQETQPQDKYREAEGEGAERLNRSRPDLAVTVSIAGAEVLFGAISAATVTGFLRPLIGHDPASIIGALVFPLGFVLVLIGRSELFTENFFIPSTRVVQHDSERGAAVRRLGRLWSLSLIFNLLGALVGALLLSRVGVLPEATLEELRHLAEMKTSRAFAPSFWSAIQAGALMTLLTWLLLSVREFGARIAIIFVVGFVIELHHFNHVIVSAGQTFIAMLSGSEITLPDWLLHNFVPAVLGNTVGGVGLVTGLRSLQVWTKNRPEPVVD